MNSSTTGGARPRLAVPKAVQTYAFWRDPHSYLRWCRRTLGATFKMAPIGKPPLVFMSRAEDIRAIVAAPPDVLLPGQGGDVIAPLIGRDSFMLADGDEHLAGRRRILPGLRPDRVNAHRDMVQAIVEREVSTWPLDAPIALARRLRALTLRVILRTIFGDDDGVDELHDRLLSMFDVAASLALHMPAFRHAPPWRLVWRKFVADREAVDAMLVELIVDRAHSHAKGRGMLAMLLGPRHVDGRGGDVESVRSTIMSLILAGHETTGSELAWAVQLLAHHPDARRRLTSELHRGDDYVDAVINEALRHRPVFLFTIPRVVAEAIDVGGTTYRPPVHLVGCVHLMQHEASAYIEPDAFRPERFLDASPRTDAWMPWGGGRKHCPGRHLAMLEMRTVLRALFERVDVEPARARIETARWRTVIVTPGSGCQVVLRSRALPRLSSATSARSS